MLKSFKTEINPTLEQKIIINKTIGTCRYIYNFYLTHNKELYNNNEKFMSGKSFSVWLNNEYIPNNPDKAWIKDAYEGLHFRKSQSNRSERTTSASGEAIPLTGVFFLTNLVYLDKLII